MLGACVSGDSWSKTLPAKRSRKDRLTPAGLSERTALLFSTQGSLPLGGKIQHPTSAARIAQLNILDAVFVAVAQRDYRAAERNLAKTMAAVSNKRKAPWQKT